MVNLKKTKEVIKKLPEHKSHLEFISALLTIPVLITVIMLNLNNLRSSKSSSSSITPSPTIVQPTPTTSLHPSMQKNQFYSSPTTIVTSQASETPTQCIKEVGPIDITYPQEGQAISDNPVCVTINYTSGQYCAVVWAYKINDGSLSDYSNNSVCLYNLPQGNNKFVLQVKSLLSNSTKTLTRTFTYQSNTTPSPTFTPTNAASPSATNH